MEVVKEICQGSSSLKAIMTTENCHKDFVSFAIQTGITFGNEPELINFNREKLKAFLLDVIIALDNTKHTGDIYGSN